MKNLLACLVLALGTWATSAGAYAEIFLLIRRAPPPLPVYAQPEPPADDFVWVPGYWAYSGDGYFWVPATWVLPPERGFLWTPGYWVSRNDLYYWRGGYWGPTVGYYGGIHYGHGYRGSSSANRVSYNGVAGGIATRPSERERRSERRYEATREQEQHEQRARRNRSLLASVNNGSPPIAATVRPGAW